MEAQIAMQDAQRQKKMDEMEAVWIRSMKRREKVPHTNECWIEYWILDRSRCIIGYF